MKSCIESQMENLSVSTFDDNALDLENLCLDLASRDKIYGCLWSPREHVSQQTEQREVIQ
jgi:hypothetical protein